MLAYVLLGHGEQTDLSQILGGFSGLHMVTLSGQTITPSTTVMVIGHGTYGSSSYAGQAELALVTALAAKGGHVVVAGDPGSATGGGVVSQVRDSTTVRSQVSTVDDADTAFGQVSAVLALAAATDGHIGHYGTGAGADALYPAPAK
jgi:hypothetical protein